MKFFDFLISTSRTDTEVRMVAGIASFKVKGIPLMMLGIDLRRYAEMLEKDANVVRFITARRAVDALVRRKCAKFAKEFPSCSSSSSTTNS